MSVELSRIMAGDSAVEVANIIYNNDAELLGAINGLSSQLYGGENTAEDSPVCYSEVVPYSSDTNSQSLANSTLIYDNQQTIQGKIIHAVRVKFSQSGTFTVLMSTAKNGSDIVWTKQFTIESVGERELIVDEYLPENQYLGFHLPADTARFAWNSGAGSNPVAGGFWYGNQYNTTNLCIGITVETSDTPAADGDIPRLWAEINAVKEGVSTQNIDYIALGDSITFGYGGVTPYPVLLGSRPGITLTENLAVSGIAAYGNSGLITEINQVPDNFAGLVTIMIGVNDSGNNLTVGDTAAVLAKDFSELNAAASFAEAFRLCLETLLRKAPDARILVILPLKAGTGVALNRIELYRQAEREICEHFAVPYSEIYKTCGISPLSYPALLPDELHPNNAGNVEIERALWQDVRTIIG